MGQAGTRRDPVVVGVNNGAAAKAEARLAAAAPSAMNCSSKVMILLPGSKPIGTAPSPVSDVGPQLAQHHWARHRHLMQVNRLRFETISTSQ